MELIEQNHCVLVEDNIKSVEYAARTCYQSWGTEQKSDSAEDLIGMLIRKKHYAMIEFATASINISKNIWKELTSTLPLDSFKFFNIGAHDDHIVSMTVSANMRAWRDLIFAHTEKNKIINDMGHHFKKQFPLFFLDYQPAHNVDNRTIKVNFIDESSLWTQKNMGNHIYRHVVFNTDRGVTHELVRHRPASFAQESTRYVRYDKGMVFIKPVWMESLAVGEYADCDSLTLGTIEHAFIKSCMIMQDFYRLSMKLGQSAQKARQVLNNAIKAQINVKTTLNHWRHIFQLRCSNEAHPQIKELMLPLLAEMYLEFPDIFIQEVEKYLPEELLLKKQEEQLYI